MRRAQLKAAAFEIVVTLLAAFGTLALILGVTT